MKMSSVGLLVIALVLLVTCSVAELATEFTEASEGSTANLPCALSAADYPDKITNILWYLGAEETPIYKFESRNNYHQHTPADALKDRYFLRVLEKQALLTISPLMISDEGVYHCRVDFERSPTKITHVNLTVVVPPTSVQLSDSMGPVKKDVTEAYAEGASLTLVCTATGGKPLAKVSWWRNQSLLTEETQYLVDRAKSQTTLRIEKLTRSHLLAVYSCEANNSKRQPPLVVRVAIDMYLRPLEVNLIGNSQQFSAGKKYNITCETKGSRPPATITWWKVVAMLGITGGCRREELHSITLQDIQDTGTQLVVTIPQTKTNHRRVFTVIDERGQTFLQLYREYLALRPKNVNHQFLFLGYRKGCCISQRVGIHTIGGVPKKIAEFLGLPDPAKYTGHCFRRTSATLLANAGADLSVLKRHGGWKSSSVAEKYIEDSIEGKNRISRMIQNGENFVEVLNQNTSTTINKNSNINDSFKIPTININHNENSTININFSVPM